MRFIIRIDTLFRLSALVLVGAATAGCSQITVTSNTLVDGTAHIADATTNAVRGTSDVTTDTSNDIDAKSNAARAKFVNSQYVMLRSEAARGRGEDLDALAYMMQAKNTQAFKAAVQSHYDQLFTGDTNAQAFLNRLYSVVGTPPDMQRAVDAG